MRTDENNNPAAFTTDVAKQAGLVEGTDYAQGTPFTTAPMWTAKILGDAIEVTIRVIDSIGYQTHAGKPRWTYVNLPKEVWAVLTHDQKRDVIGFHYQNEGGTVMRSRFPNYGAAWLPLPFSWYRRLH